MEGQNDVTYLRKIFPRAKHQKTTHHSELCTLGQKLFLGPSISKGGEPKRVEDKESEPNLAHNLKKKLPLFPTQVLKLAKRNLDPAI